MKKYLFTKVLFFACITALLASCAALQPAPAPLPPLRVEYTYWWGDYALLVAHEKGFFEEYGVEVEPVYYEVFSKMYSDLAAGQLDAGFMATGDAININRYTPLNIILMSDDGGYMPIVANPEIRSVADLRGKTLGTLVGTQYELLHTEMLASAGMTAADIKIRNINPEELSDALENNIVQAAFSWEPFTTQAINAGAHVIYPANNNLRLFPDTLAFRKSVVDERPQDIQAFLNAWFKAVDYRLKNPEETRLIAAKYLGVPVEDIQPDPNLRIYTYEDNLVAYTVSVTEENSIYNITQKTADYLISSGALAIKPKLELLITPQFLMQVQE